MSPAQKLRVLLQDKNIIVAPGVFDGLSALLSKQAGFPVLYASGGAISRSFGYPDLGLLTFTEVCNVVSTICSITELPIIADVDTGFGNVLNVRRTVQEFERIGVAAIHIEDQTFPKRCGHLDNKSIISCEEMCNKISIAKQSLKLKEMLIIARTDAIAVQGFEVALERAEAYQNAGADMIFIEAPETIEQIEIIASRISGFKLINMFHGGKTPVVPLSRLQSLGYNVVIIPSDLQRAAIKAMQTTLTTIQLHGNTEQISENLTSFKERELIVGTTEYLALDKFKYT